MFTWRPLAVCLLFVHIPYIHVLLLLFQCNSGPPVFRKVSLHSTLRLFQTSDNTSLLHYHTPSSIRPLFEYHAIPGRHCNNKPLHIFFTPCKPSRHMIASLHKRPPVSVPFLSYSFVFALRAYIKPRPDIHPHLASAVRISQCHWQGYSWEERRKKKNADKQLPNWRRVTNFYPFFSLFSKLLKRRLKYLFV